MRVWPVFLLGGAREAERREGKGRVRGGDYRLEVGRRGGMGEQGWERWGDGGRPLYSTYIRSSS